MRTEPDRRRIRQRDTILSCLEEFRLVCDEPRLTAFVAFLYIAENEGLSLSELSRLSSVTLPVASRLVSRMMRRDTPLLKARPAGRERLLFLTPEGAALRDRLDRRIERPVLISGARSLDLDAES